MARPRRWLRVSFIVGIAAVGAALVAVILLSNRQGGASEEQIAGATGTLTAPRSFYDFGRISMKDGKVSYRFPVRNDSDSPALVEQISTTCMCTEASLLIGGERLGPFGMQGHGSTPRIDRIVAPGQEAVVEAVFDPKAHGPAGVGRNDRAVTLQLGGRRALQLQFTAYVTP
jgi:hypothetical protein